MFFRNLIYLIRSKCLTFEPFIWEKSCVFDDTIADFLSWKYVLVFSQNSRILEAVVNARKNLLKKKKYCIYSKNLDNFSKYESIIFTTETFKHILQKAVETIDSVFIALPFDRGISEIFKKYCSKFVVFDFGSKFIAKPKVFEKHLLQADELEFENEKIELDLKIKQFIQEDNCLVFSENSRILGEIIEQRIDHLSKKFEKILFISSLSSLGDEVGVTKCNFQIFSTSYLATLDLKSSFDAIVICENLNEDLNEFIAKILESHSNVFVALWNDPQNIFQIFKESNKKFIFLSVNDDSSCVAKIFGKRILTLKDSYFENEEIELDLKVKGHICARYCLVFSERRKILEKISRSKIQDLLEKRSRILVISSLLSNGEFLKLKNSAIAVHNFEFFVANYIFKNRFLPLNWEINYDKELSKFKFSTNFDAIVIFEKTDKYLEKLVLHALRTHIDCFVALWNDPQNILQTFKENSQKFTFLNFDKDLLGEAKIFEKPLLSIQTEFFDDTAISGKHSILNELRDSNLLEDKKLSSKAYEILGKFSCPLVIFSENNQINGELVSKRIELLISELNLKNEEIFVSFSFLSIDKYLESENKYKAFIIIAPVDCEQPLKELLSRIKDKHKNIIWFVNPFKWLKEDFLIVDRLFPIYEKYKVREFKEGKLIDIEKFGKSFGFLKQDNEDSLFSYPSKDNLYEIDPLFDESISLKISDEESEDDDIGGGLL